MANQYFRFKQFTINQDRCAMKITTDSCLFGAWIADLIKGKEYQKGLDIGAGTGLLSLMMAQANSLQIEAIEIEQEAAEQASQNIAGSPWSTRISVIQADIRSFSGGPYELIVSNPPFYEADLSGPDAKRNIAHHSRELLLPDLVEKAASLLQWDGDFYLLLPSKRHAAAIGLLSQNGFAIRQETWVHPSPLHQPIRVMLHVSKWQAVKRSETLYLKETSGQYSNEFTRLLQPYYLYL